jgi:LmbE family N-acetylglucosaminyl deacetylase
MWFDGFSEPLWKRATRRGLTAATTALWQLGFRTAGLLARPQARAWTAKGGQTVWVLAPHPDDETVGCAGVIVRHRKAGDQVTILVITDGRGSRAFGLSPPDMANCRREEAHAATAILNVHQLIWLGLPEYGWEIDQLTGELVAAWHTYPPPDILYAPSRVDFHPEHLKVATAVALALREKPEIIVRVYPIQVPLAAALTNVVCDVSAEAATIQRAITAYATQRHSMGAALRQRRYAAAFYRSGRLVESFWEVPARQYVGLHLPRPAGESQRPFRGLRAWPFTDPLAYWQRRRERQRLAERAESSDEYSLTGSRRGI